MAWVVLAALPNSTLEQMVAASHHLLVIDKSVVYVSMGLATESEGFQCISCNRLSIGE